MESRGDVNTAEKENMENDQNTVTAGSVLSGALKSGSSQRHEKAKRASAVRFADQINKSGLDQKLRESMHISESAASAGSGIRTRVAGMQVVGS